MLNKGIEATRAQAEACLLPIGLPISFWELLSLKVVGLLQGQPHRRFARIADVRQHRRCAVGKLGTSEAVQSMAPPRVVGLGDPVMDILAHVSHDYLASVASEPGGCFAIPPEEMATLLASAGKQSELNRIPGGSAANVTKGLTNIMKEGVSAQFIGMIGKDATGSEYRERLQSHGVKPLLLESSSGAPSACAVCLVTPDGQRTMRTCLGASLELQSASQIGSEWCRDLALLHCEGYCLYRPKLAREMMQAAKAAGAVVSMDLASFELVRNCKGSFVELLESGCLDLVFANQEEAAEMAEVLSLAPATASHNDKVAATQAYLLRHIRVSVVSLGPKGCTARSADGTTAAAPAAHVKVVDTIGAGDFFTAGFLSAYLQGASLQRCAEAGCAAGAEAVQAVGAELSPAALDRLRCSIAALVAKKGAGSSSRWGLPVGGWVSGQELLYLGLPLCVLALGVVSQVLRRAGTRGVTL